MVAAVLPVEAALAAVVVVVADLAPLCHRGLAVATRCRQALPRSVALVVVGVVVLLLVAEVYDSDHSQLEQR